MTFRSINPVNNQLLRTYNSLSDKELQWKIVLSKKAFEGYRKTTFCFRAQLLNQLAEILEANKETLAKLMTLEVGKPITQSTAEIEKCAWVCRYYAENGAEFLQSKKISAALEKESIVRYDPLGSICLLYTSPSPRDLSTSRMPSSA